MIRATAPPLCMNPTQKSCQRLEKNPVSMHPGSFLSCLTLCDPVDCGLLGFFIHGILQAKILEQVAMPFLSTVFPAALAACYPEYPVMPGPL